MSNINDKVEQLLKDNARLRDSDLALIGAFWATEGFVMTPEQKQKFMTLTTPESISRQRRRLRDTYPGSEEVEKARFVKYIEARDEFGYKIMKEVRK